jgi:hypothetical protein
VLDGWRKIGRSAVARSRILRKVVSKGAYGLMDAYFSNKAARKCIEGVGLHRLITQTPLFYLPQAGARDTLVEALGSRPLFPQVKAEMPVMIETWQQENELQVHLVNYALTPQTVQVFFNSQVSARAISPDFDGQRSVEGRTLNVEVDVYTILLV